MRWWDVVVDEGRPRQRHICNFDPSHCHVCTFAREMLTHRALTRCCRRLIFIEGVGLHKAKDSSGEAKSIDECFRCVSVGRFVRTRTVVILLVDLYIIWLASWMLNGCNW